MHLCWNLEEAVYMMTLKRERLSQSFSGDSPQAWPAGSSLSVCREGRGLRLHTQRLCCPLRQAPCLPGSTFQPRPILTAPSNRLLTPPRAAMPSGKPQPHPGCKVHLGQWRENQTPEWLVLRHVGFFPELGWPVWTQAQPPPNGLAQGYRAGPAKRSHTAPCAPALKSVAQL